LRFFFLGLTITQSADQPSSPNASVPETSDVMAAVDLGSNSFHMVVARLQHGQLVIVDRLREMVRLASGLDKRAKLTTDSQKAALACLRRFGERLREMHADRVRVVGTNTLRKARNSRSFLTAAEEALEHPVEIISGMEEARLIYLGVSHHVPGPGKPMLVIDIGGGSTELIIGDSDEPNYLESLFMGCVAWSSRHFGSGKISRKRFDRARLAARLELQPVVERFRSLGWRQAIGSSGTIRVAERIARAMELVDAGLTVEALEAIIDRMIEAGSVRNLDLPELTVQRAPVFAGGMAILVETMSALGIERLHVSDGALREGLLYDMLGRLQHEDARDRTIRAMQLRYNVDRAQADRVEQTALHLLRETRKGWNLKGGSCRRYLAWASQLHEVGLDIAHAKYHQHGGYLVENAYLPGFASVDQRILAILIGHHRRKVDDLFLDDMSDEWQERIPRLLALFRVAVLLNRSRSPVALAGIDFKAAKSRLTLSFPDNWLSENPLTQADLEQEIDWLQALDVTLQLMSAD
jgi:exopolyphosphatase/guanosine-5'-triphosphate,3'-diphosphate pyrophosphatase